MAGDNRFVGFVDDAATRLGGLIDAAAGRGHPEACTRMSYRARHGAVRGQMSGLRWIRAPDGGFFGIAIVRCPATACRRVPSG